MARLIKTIAGSKSRAMPGCTVLITILILLGLPFGVSAGGYVHRVVAGKTSFIPLSSAVNRVTVGDPDVADVTILDPTHLYIVGKRLGSTNVILLCGSGPCKSNPTLQLEVTHDLDGLKAKLYELFPNEAPKVLSSQGSIVLAGQVSSLQKMDAIEKIANTFLLQGEQSSGPTDVGTQVTVNMGAQAESQGQGSRVINLMQVGGPQQVMLGVTVAEIDRRLARNFKVDFSAVGGGSQVSAGAVSGNALVNTLSSIGGNPLASSLSNLTTIGSTVINPYGLFFRFLSSDASVKTVINAARDNGLAKVLAEPNLTVISGQDADFLSGGEFPIPVPQNVGTGGTNTITIQFKPFGVMLKFLPVVLDSGRISMKLNIDVSEISADNAVLLPAGNASFVIPSLTKRSANSSLELDDGQTLGIAGLLSDNMRESVSKFPGLGDIPVLGQLFTSQTFLKNETELVIFVTPHLVKPIAPENIRLPTDFYIEASDVEYYLMGRTEARKMPARVKPAQPYSGGLRGHFGQQP
jgi:pilus assembly protein CpaC